MFVSQPADRKAFIVRLKQAMERGMFVSARSLSEVCDLPPARLRRIVKGKTDPSRIEMVEIAAACGVSVGWLANDEGPMRTEQQEALTRYCQATIVSMAQSVRSELEFLVPSVRIVLDLILAGQPVHVGDIARLRKHLEMSEAKLRDKPTDLMIQINRDAD